MEDDKLALSRLEQLLEENLELAEENNKLLRDMRRTGRIAFWTKLVIWAAVIILPFLLLGPILKALVPAAGGSTPGVNFFGFPSEDQIKDVLDAYQGELPEN